jgi:hypothetical protein
MLGGSILWIIGRGPQPARSQTLNRELHLGQRVRFQGARRSVVPFVGRGVDYLICSFPGFRLWGWSALKQWAAGSL